MEPFEAYSILRYGGEEFVILMPETGLEEACHVAERVRQNVSDLTFEQGESFFSVTLSLGAAEAIPTMKKSGRIADVRRPVLVRRKSRRKKPGGMLQARLM